MVVNYTFYECYLQRQKNILKMRCFQLNKFSSLKGLLQGLSKFRIATKNCQDWCYYNFAKQVIQTVVFLILTLFCNSNCFWKLSESSHLVVITLVQFIRLDKQITSFQLIGREHKFLVYYCHCSDRFIPLMLFILFFAVLIGLINLFLKIFSQRHILHFLLFIIWVLVGN